MQKLLAVIFVLFFLRSVDCCGLGPLFSALCSPPCPPRPVCPPPPVCAPPPLPPVQIAYGGGGGCGGYGAGSYTGGTSYTGGASYNGGASYGGGGYVGGVQRPCSGGGCGRGNGGKGYGRGGGGYSCDCCSSCRKNSCRFRQLRLHGAPTTVRGVDPKCNSESLRTIMRENMSSDTTTSKRAIQKAAQEKFKGKYDVICTTGDLSYVVNTDFFCLETLAGSTCYAFRH